jgi:dihydrofolate reductase
MGKVFLDMAVSLDGFISGPNGEDWGLHDWYFAPSDISREIVEALPLEIGAMVVGKRAYGAAATALPSEDDPYQMPHFVLTHTPPDPATVKDPRVTFVTDGPARALALARVAANGNGICIAGGANTAQQFLNAGLVDEIRLHVVPVIFGAGVRLLEHTGDAPIRLQRTQVIAAPDVTHLRFDVVKNS